MTDRRHVKARSLLSVGIMLGWFAAQPIELIAQGVTTVSAWMQPPVVMSMVGVVLSVGMAWQLVTEDRRRIANLERDAIRKDSFDETMKRIDGSLELLLTWAQQDRHPGSNRVP